MMFLRHYLVLIHFQRSLIIKYIYILKKTIQLGHGQFKEEIYDATTNSIKLTENHPINALEADTHEYKLLFLIDTTGVEKEDFGYKFIYSLDVRQVS